MNWKITWLSTYTACIHNQPLGPLTIFSVNFISCTAFQGPIGDRCLIEYFVFLTAVWSGIKFHVWNFHMDLYVICLYICNGIFNQSRAKLFSLKWFRFHVDARLGTKSCEETRQDKQSMSSPLLAPTLSTCVNLSPLVHVHVLEPLLPLQQSCHVNLLSSFPPAKLPVTWSSEVILPNGNLIQLTRCRVFFSFEEKHLVKQNSNRPPKLLLNNT